jgi:1-acyl-sn-glycerol-3-phosphate acyltransferase
MKESLRPKEQRYRVEWERRRGFVKLALRSQVPIVLVACGAADDLYNVRQSRLTSFAYERFRVPLPVIFGRRGTPIPKKIPLRAFISEPFYPPVHDPENEASQVESLHGPIVERMQELMKLR